jgi:hypothetical protein
MCSTAEQLSFVYEDLEKKTKKTGCCFVISNPYPFS